MQIHLIKQEGKPPEVNVRMNYMDFTAMVIAIEKMTALSAKEANRDPVEFTPTVAVGNLFAIGLIEHGRQLVRNELYDATEKECKEMGARSLKCALDAGAISTEDISEQFQPPTEQ